MLEDINVFTIIAKHQSLSKAARELGISTPVVTRRLARLEKTLNTRLLNRTTRSVSLTEAGDLFYGEVHNILQALEASKECVKSLTSKVSGTLKVALPNAFSQCFISKGLSKFLAEYPNLKIQVQSGAGNNLLHHLNEGFDLVIHCGNLPNSSYHYKKLGTMKKIICASPKYLEKHGTPKNLDDLYKHNCLGIGNNFTHTWQVMSNGEKTEIYVNGNIGVNDAIDVRNLAVHDAGIAYLPCFLIREQLKNGQLISILAESHSDSNAIYAVYPTDKFLGKKTQLFLNFMTDLLLPIFN